MLSTFVCLHRCSAVPANRDPNPRCVRNPPSQMASIVEGKLTTCYEHSSGVVCLHFTLSYMCLLLLIICELCVTRYRGFAYILSIVHHVISWLCYILLTVRFYFLLLDLRLALAGGTSATVVRLTVLFYFLFMSNETALAGGTSATVIRLTFFSFCRTRRRWPEAPPPQSSG